MDYFRPNGSHPAPSGLTRRPRLRNSLVERGGPSGGWAPLEIMLPYFCRVALNSALKRHKVWALVVFGFLLLMAEKLEPQDPTPLQASVIHPHPSHFTKQITLLEIFNSFL